MQRAIVRLPRHLSRRTPPMRAFNHSTRHNSSPFAPGPSPPRLPKEEQEIFERLQQQSTGAFSTPRTEEAPPSTPSSSSNDFRMRINQSPDSSEAQTRASEGEGVEIRIEGGNQIRDGEEVHPNMRRGAPPEFEGDVNPKTGEVGGPKNEPLRWGSEGDWSFNGRVTDF